MLTRISFLRARPASYRKTLRGSTYYYHGHSSAAGSTGLHRSTWTRLSGCQRKMIPICEYDYRQLFTSKFRVLKHIKGRSVERVRAICTKCYHTERLSVPSIRLWGQCTAGYNHAHKSVGINYESTAPASRMEPETFGQDAQVNMVRCLLPPSASFLGELCCTALSLADCLTSTWIIRHRT